MQWKCITDYFRDLKKWEVYECDEAGTVEVCKQKHEMVKVNGVQYRKDNFDFNVENNPKQIIVPILSQDIDNF